MGAVTRACAMVALAGAALSACGTADTAPSNEQGAEGSEAAGPQQCSGEVITGLPEPTRFDQASVIDVKEPTPVRLAMTISTPEASADGRTAVVDADKGRRCGASGGVPLKHVPPGETSTWSLTTTVPKEWKGDPVVRLNSDDYGDASWR